MKASRDLAGKPSSRDAFEDFVVACEPTLRQALTAMFGIDGGREAAADALGYAWEHWERIATMANPTGYLFVVGRNRHRRGWRARRSRPVFDVGSQPSEPWCEPALVEQLARLSDRERVAVLLVHGFEWSLTEVADLLGVTKSTAQTHADRGMAKLRAGLGVAT
ncbi:MAG TPA: sigma-70 family RNA polymerase sigma factor [Acidimicrobiales bacterium]|nr:sigma-70 family RNA polymerase sigma factor [Acidimicrobiales bacterium]